MYRKNLVFFAACFGMLLFGIVFLSLGAMVTMLVKRFHLGDSQIGTLTALLPGGILAGSLVFGPIVDRFGYRWLLVVAAAMVGAALEGIAFAGSIASVQFYILLIGFGGGILNGATNALAADVSAGERGAKLSLLGVFFGLGALGMPGTLALLSRHFADYIIVAVIGSIVILPIIYFLTIQFPPPKKSKGLSLAESIGMLKEPTLLLMSLLLAFQSGMEGMSNDWLTRYFTKVLQVDEQRSLAALTAMVAAMTVTRLLLGGLLKAVASHKILFISVAFTAAGAWVLCLKGAFNVSLLGGILIGIGLSACFPVVLGYIGDLYPDRSGTAFSIAFVIALSGNMTINKMMGHVGERYGTEQFTKVLLACLLAATVLLVFIIQRIRNTNPNLIKNHEQARETMAR